MTSFWVKLGSQIIRNIHPWWVSIKQPTPRVLTKLNFTELQTYKINIVDKMRSGLFRIQWSTGSGLEAEAKCETKFFSLRVVYERNVRYFELWLRVPVHNWSGSAPLSWQLEEKMYTEWQYQFENRRIRTTVSKLVGVLIFATVLSLLAEKQSNTAQNES